MQARPSPLAAPQTTATTCAAVGRRAAHRTPPRITHRCVCACTTTSVSILPPPPPTGTHWVKGVNGQTCNAVCSAHGVGCDSSSQSSLPSAALATSAFQQAGYTCTNVGGCRTYAGTPFSTGRSSDDCFI
eukprot:5086336-Prymnesium_polylepis.1